MVSRFFLRGISESEADVGSVLQACALVLLQGCLAFQQQAVVG